MTELRLRRTAGGVQFAVRLQPRARAPGLAGLHGDALKVRVSAPPVDGAANAMLIEVLATTFGVPAKSVAIVSGQTSRSKLVEVAGVSEADVRRIVASS